MGSNMKQHNRYNSSLFSLKPTDSESKDLNHYPRQDGGNGEDPERIPFLRATERPSSPSDEDENYQHIRSPNAFSVIVSATVLMFIMDIVGLIPVAPQMVIFEKIICREYYAEWQAGAGLSNACKIEPVQSELAIINGWWGTFETIPVLLASVFYGALADHIGRKNVLVLALIGKLLGGTWVAIVCGFCLMHYSLDVGRGQHSNKMLGFWPEIFPLRMIWLSGIWQMIGGGTASVMSMCFTLTGDACSPDQRTTAFSQVYAALLISQLVSIPIGSSLISVNPWIPILGSLCLITVAIVFVPFLTPNFSSPHMKQQCASEDLPSMSSGKIRDRLNKRMAKLAIACQWMTKDVLLILGAFFIGFLGRRVSGIILQYSSYKFNWEFSKASYLYSLGAGVSLLVLFTLVPALNRFFINYWRCSQEQADKNIALGSGLCFIIGSIFLFLAPSPFFLILGKIFFAAGIPFTVTARSLLTAMVDKRHLGLVFTSVTVITNGGIIVGGPLMAAAFQWGLHLGHSWVGMPFLVSTVLFVVATLAVSAAKVS